MAPTDIRAGSRTPQILKLHDKGLTTRQIASALGMSTQCVYRALKRQGRRSNG